MIEIIEEFIKKENMDYGICDASKLDFTEIREAPFVNCTFEERINPKLYLENCKSIIALVMPYDFNINNKDKPYIASGYSHYDYHNLMKEKFKNLIEQMQEVESFDYKIHIDTGPLMEKAICVKAGLGALGKNNLLISKKFGSRVFVGLILTTLDLPLNEPFNKDLCGKCNKCIESCTTGALSDTFDYKKCISYFTQKKEDLNEYESEKIKNRLFGCDDCIKICPHNKNVNELSLDIEYNDLMEISNKQFKVKFGHTGIYWRGKKIIKRNGLIPRR